MISLFSVFRLKYRMKHQKKKLFLVVMGFKGCFQFNFTSGRTKLHITKKLQRLNMNDVFLKVIPDHGLT